MPKIRIRKDCEKLKTSLYSLTLNERPLYSQCYALSTNKTYYLNINKLKIQIKVTDLNIAIKMLTSRFI